ncbi:DUF2249 domain-containing protein [Virgibacillus sp. MSP4-1]|uniref:DUF2249 domain-containing protein n=1 Tax=Virgibacillus sp. MSP4-1 TaxID=2700081 RepID=UPI0003A2651D|nr:DUF2249 domain-containing protein [Virgibacillus sp. MSP4-1]QHS21718.1 DUF2249 domain-containing protein [Virgibacillus sp. MSP4-1]
MTEQPYEFVTEIMAPEIEPRIRHPKIFEAFDGLQSGEVMKLVNDHDPRPLQYQFMMEREGEFTWEYLQEGPDLWKVAIGKK